MSREGYHLEPRLRDLGPASPREAEVIEFARSFASGVNRHVPRWIAAGMLFFRLDPGFRGEVAAARIEWVGSPEAPCAGSAPPRWDDDDVLASLALGFAARWGILVEDA